MSFRIVDKQGRQKKEHPPTLPPPIPDDPQTVLWGVAQSSAPSNLATLTQVEQAAGKLLGHVQWGKNMVGATDAPAYFSTTDLNTIWNRGQVPVINPLWAGGGNKLPRAVSAGIDNNIALGQADASGATTTAGLYDDWYAAQITHIQNYQAAGGGRRVIIRWSQEMNSPGFGQWSEVVGSNSGRNDQGTFAAAWRYMWKKFEAAGVNVAEGGPCEHFWCALYNPGWFQSRSSARTELLQFFPGAGYVDWVGVDGYNKIQDDIFRSFTLHYAQDYSLLSDPDSGDALAPNTPFFVGEFGCSLWYPKGVGWGTGPDSITTYAAPYTSAGGQAAWVKQALASIVDGTFPLIRAISWFNTVGGVPTGGDSQAYDYRIHNASNPNLKQAFALGIGDSRYVQRS